MRRWHSFGAVLAAVVAVRQPEVGGLKALLTHPAVQDKLSFIPEFSVWATNPWE